MHPTIEYEIARAQIADRQHQADRIAIGQAASKASRRLTSQDNYPAARPSRRIFIVLATRRLPALARFRQPAACQSPASCSTCA